MRVTLIAVGSRGDVQPVLALGRGLADDGHKVRIATEHSYLPSAVNLGLEVYPLSGETERFNAGRGGKLFRDSVQRPVTRFRRFWQAHVAPAARVHMRETVGSVVDADLVICQPWFGIGPTLAQKFKIPVVVAGIFPVPALPARTFPFPLHETTGADLGKEGNRRSWRRAIPVLRAGHQVIQDWRGELGLPTQSFAESFETMQAMPHLLGYSALVVPKPAEWGDKVAVTGYWFLGTRHDYEPSEELARFLAAGDPPVVVGFGSHVGRDPRRLTATVVEALALVGRRGVLITGWGGLKDADLPPQVLGAREVPYDWLLPRAAALVHHGGAGTTAIALRQGVPQVIVPFGWDQMFWGHRCALLGVAPRPTAAKELTTPALAEAIRQAVEAPAFGRNARQVGSKIAAERGIRNAVDAVNTFASAAGRAR